MAKRMKGALTPGNGTLNGQPSHGNGQLVARSIGAETGPASDANGHDRIPSDANGHDRIPGDANGHDRIASPLADSELRYRRLFEAAKDGILILDGDTGQITDANPFLQGMLGYSRDELLGKTLWEIGPFKDVIASKEAFRQLQAKEYVRYENLPLESKKHERREVEFVSNVYMVDGQRVIQCNVRDISARKESEDRTKQDNEDLFSLVAQLRRRERDMQILSDTNDLLQSCTTQEEAFEMIALKAKQLFVGQSGCLAIRRAHEGPFEPVARWGQEGPLMSGFSLEDCWALRLGHSHEVLEPHPTVSCNHFVRPPTSPTLCVPLTVQGDTFGVLCLIGATSGRDEYPSSRLHLAVATGEMIKLVLSNLKLREGLREQANHDSLTGLFNRRYLDDSLSRELSLSQRRGTSLSVAILDIDHFKRFNDSFGHDAGDLALREFSRVLSQNLRKSDIACRLGGEEFALVLPDSPLADTLQRVGCICSLIRHLELKHKGRRLGKMTVSAGIAASPEHASTAGELLTAADSALYAAKRAGREKVLLYEPTA